MATFACARCGASITVAAGSVTCGQCGAVNAVPRHDAAPAEVRPVATAIDASGARRDLACPRCRTPMTGVVLEDVELDGCGRCGGVWVDNASGRALLAAPRSVFVDMADRAAANTTATPPDGPRSCAVCAAPLSDVTIQGVALDVCGVHGTWFDAHELATLVQRLLAQKNGVVITGRGSTEETTAAVASFSGDESNESATISVAGDLAVDLLGAIVDGILNGALDD